VRIAAATSNGQNGHKALESARSFGESAPIREHVKGEPRPKAGTTSMTVRPFAGQPVFRTSLPSRTVARPSPWLAGAGGCRQMAAHAIRPAPLAPRAFLRNGARPPSPPSLPGSLNRPATRSFRTQDSYCKADEILHTRTCTRRQKPPCRASWREGSGSEIYLLLRTPIAIRSSSLHFLRRWLAHPRSSVFCPLNSPPRLAGKRRWWQSAPRSACPSVLPTVHAIPSHLNWTRLHDTVRRSHVTVVANDPPFHPCARLSSRRERRRIDCFGGGRKLTSSPTLWYPWKLISCIAICSSYSNGASYCGIVNRTLHDAQFISRIRLAQSAGTVGSAPVGTLFRLLLA